MHRKKKPAATSTPFGWPQLWPYLILAILAFGVYAGTLENGFVWDDSGQLLKNPVVVDFRKIPAIFQQDVWNFERAEGTEKTNYYRPVQMLVYMGIYYVAGFSALAFHLLMVLIHVANTLLVFAISRHFLKHRDPAIVAAALFAVHPIHTEAVAWVAALPDVLSTLWVLLSLLLFIRQDAAPRGWRIAGHSVLFLLALLTKETGVALVLLLAGFEWFCLGNRPREFWKNRPLYGSLLATFSIYLALRFQALGGLAPGQGRHYQLGPGQLFLNAIAFMGRYFYKLVWPTNLSSYHAFDPLTSLNLAVVLAVVAIIAIGTAILFAPPEAAFGLFAIVIPLLPVMNLNGIGEAPFAERYLYLPSVGFVCLVGWAWHELWNRGRSLAWGVATVVLAACTYGVAARIPDWHDDISLYTVTARQYPNSAPVRIMLAQYHQFQGDTEQAIAEYRAAIRLQPGNAILHNSLATLLARTGQPQEAIEEFQQTIKLKPSYWPAFVNMAQVFEGIQAPEKAVTAYERALQLKPDCAPALNGLAVIRRKDYPAAIDLLKRAVAADPTFTEAYLNLGLVYSDLANYREAAAAFQKAIEVGSQSPALYLAHYGLGVSYVRLNSLDAAAAEFARVLQLKPDYVPAQQALDTLRKR